MTLYRPIRKSTYRLLGKPFYKRYSKQSKPVVFQKPCKLTGKRCAAVLERERVVAYQDSTQRHALLQQGIRARQRYDKQQARLRTEAIRKETAAAKRAKEADQRFQRACKRQQRQQQQQQEAVSEEYIPEQSTILTDLFTGFNLIS